MHLYKLLAVVVGVMPVAIVNAQQSTPLTLAEAEDRALASEPGQLAFEARAAALDERAVAVTQLPDPQLRLGVNNYPLDGGSFSREGMSHMLVGIQQMVPPGRTRSISAQRYEALADRAESQGDARGRDVLLAVRKGWLDLYYLDRAHELVSESRPFFEELASVTRSLYSVGRKSQQDVLHAELELSRLDDRLIDIERTRMQGRAALGEWLGADAGRPIAAKLPPWTAVPALSDMHAALSTHPAMTAAMADSEASTAGVGLARQRSKPGWSVNVGYSSRNGTLASGAPRSDFLSVGVTVELPFLRRKSVDSTLAAALSEKSAAKSQELAVHRSLESRLEGEYARWHELSRRLELYEQRILAQSKERAEAAMLAYQSDSADFADVMRGYIDALNARIEYERLQVERAQSYAVLANLGGLPR